MPVQNRAATLLLWKEAYKMFELANGSEKIARAQALVMSDSGKFLGLALEFLSGGDMTSMPEG